MKLKISVIIGLTAVLFLLVACGAAQPEDAEQTEPDGAAEVAPQDEPIVKTIQINSEQVPCEGAGPQMCYQFRETPDAAWQLWYDDIAGFEYEEGNLYTLQIAETVVENPPQDGSAVAWSLISVASVDPVGTGEDTAVAEQQPATITDSTDFIPIVIEDLGIEAVVPADWLPIGDDPLIANGWGLDQLTFVSFNVAPGEDAKQALAELVSVDPASFMDGSLAGEYDEVEVNGRFWAIYTQLNPDINLAQTAAITEEDGTVYLVSLFVDSEQTEPVLLPVLEGFAIMETDVAAQGAEGDAEAVTEATEAPDAAVEPAALVGTEWNMLTMNGNPPAEGTQLTAVFSEDGAVNGYSGCNDYFGPYTTDETTLSVGPLAITRRACDETTGPQEMAYLDALESAATYQIVDNQLLLSDADGNVVLTYGTVQGLTLQGAPWTLTAYLDGGPLVSVLPDEQVTAVFGEDNIVTGTGGCNNYSADYNSNDTQLSIGLPRATLSNCAEPEGIMRKEALYLNLLTAAASYKIDATTLSLFDAEGTLLLTYTTTE